MFVAALANGKVDVAYGSIRPKVEVPACLCDPYRLHQEGREGCRRLQFNRIDRKAHDRLGNLRQQGEDAYNKCFSQRARSSRHLPRRRSRQALLTEAMGK